MRAAETTPRQPALQRVLGFWALVACGVGDILGAGIYALIGKVAGVAGAGCWVAFLISLGVAALTALSYAELGSRFPKSAGEATFCRQAFRSGGISLGVGWLVLCSGVVSMATVSRAFAGYSQTFLPALPTPLLIVGFLLALTAVNLRGMRESSWANLFCTAVELSGLLLVIGAGWWYLTRPGPASPQPPPPNPAAWGDLLAGAALAFFAFIGFEDMVNVAEEVKAPERDMPRAILLATGIAGFLYIAVSFLAVRVIPPAELAQSKAPLLEVIRQAAPFVPAGLFSLVALFAVANTALLNFVMGSRLLYGMSQERLVPAWLGAVHPRRHTPHRAILILLAVALTLALSGSLTFLAGATSSLILIVFAVVNASLLVVKSRSTSPPALFSVPKIVPALGVVASLGLAAFVPLESWLRALILVGLGALLALTASDRALRLNAPLSPPPPPP